MQSATVLLLELAFKAQHVPDKEEMVSNAVKKAVEWLFSLSKENSASGRAWKLCDGYLRYLAPHVGLDISDLPINDEYIAAATVRAPAEVSAPAVDHVTFHTPSPPQTTAVPTGCGAGDSTTVNLDPIRFSPMDGVSTSVDFTLSYGLDPTETLEFLKNDQKQFTMRSPYSEFIQLDPAQQSMPGPSNFCSTPNCNVDLELGGYLWCDSIS